MFRRGIVVAVALLLAAGTAVADDFSCRPITGTGSVALRFSLVRTDASFAVGEATFQLDDSTRYSTAAADGAKPVTVADLDLDNKLEFRLLDGDTEILFVNMVTHIQDGGVNATGSMRTADHVWAIRCDIAPGG